MYSYSTFVLKSFCVRTQIAKTEYLPSEYIPPTFWLEAPSPFCAVWRWGLLSRKIFFIFSEHCFNSSSFHSVFLISFYLFSFYTCFITIWDLLHIVENYGFDVISRFRISDSKFLLVFYFLFFQISSLYSSDFDFPIISS